MDNGPITRQADSTAGMAASVPLSANQQAQWLLRAYAPASAAYHPAWAVRLQATGPAGDLETARIERAVQALGDRHPMTRMLIVPAAEDGVAARQRPGAAPHLPFTETDARGWSAERLAEALKARNGVPFDLEREPPLRAVLFRLADGEAVLLISMHHIAVDGWSTALLMRDLGRALTTGEALPDADGENGFAAMPPAEAAWLEGAEARAAWRHWTQVLAGPLPVLALPGADRPRPAVKSFDGLSVPLLLRPDVPRRLRSLAATLEATPFAVLMAAWQALLHRASGQTDILVGTPTWGPRDAGTREVVGYYANLIPVRASPDPDLPFDTLVAAVRDTLATGLPHAAFPFSTTVARLDERRDPAITPVFQSTFAFHQTRPDDTTRTLFAMPVAGEEPPALVWGNLEARPLAVPDQGAGQFDLALDLFDLGERIQGELKADAALFDRSTLAALAEAFGTLLEGALAAPDTALADLPTTRPEDLPAHLRLANCPARPVPQAPPLIRHFLDHAVRDPQRPALSAGETRLTYAALARRATAVALDLAERGVGPGSLVGLVADRGPDQIVGLLGIVMAGGAYVPLDPDYPRERLDLIGADAGLTLLVGPPARAPLADTLGLALVPISGEEADITALDRLPQPEPDDPAYVIYTSGSTGRPKGVPVPHRALTRLIHAADGLFDFGADDVWSLFHSLAFDFSVWEIWGALAKGGRLVQVDPWQARDPAALLDLLSDERVTVLNQVPSAFHRLAALDAARDSDTAPPLALRWVIFGGEALDPRRLGDWAARHGLDRPALVTMYGITETTVHVTHLRLTATHIAAGGSPIGQPLPDLELHLLDRRGRPVARGLPGELVVGGAGVAGGYLNQPDLTAERFLPSPFVPSPFTNDTDAPRQGARLYKSGDLGRRRTDGGLDFLGRLDDQIKLRGFRIEPAEIEAALQALPGVQETAVALAGSGEDARMVAYVVGLPGMETAPDALRAALTERLPPHMVPHRIIPLPALPRTPSGKLDRRALPDPDSATPPSSGTATVSRTPPRTPEEQAVAAVFADALGGGEVGAHDGFFALGGDSIRSLRVLAGLKARGYAVTLETLFHAQTVAAVARALTPLDPASGAAPYVPFSGLEPGDRARLTTEHPGLEDGFPATALQTGMIFHSERDADQGTFHDIFAYHLSLPLDAAALERAVSGLIAAHGVLRTAFDVGRYSRPLQLVSATVDLPLTIADTPWDGPLDTLIEAQKGRPLPIDRAPLIRFHAVAAPDRSFRLVVVFHHAILDGWSMASLMTEVTERYRALLESSPWTEPAPPPPPFAAYVLGVDAPARTDPAARNHWRTRLAGHEGSGLVRPTPSSSPPLAIPRQRSLSHILPDTLCAALRRRAERLGLPLRTLLLTGFLRVLGPLGAERDVIAGVARHGRPETAGSDRTLGLFLNTLPLRLDLGAAPRWADICRLCYETEREDLPHSRFPLSEILRATGRRRLFDAVFNHVHFHVSDAIAPLIRDRRTFEQTDIPLVLHALQDGERLTLLLHHDTGQVTGTVADRLLSALPRALEALATEPDAPHTPFGLMAPDETAAQPAAWTGNAVPYPRDATVPALFAEQAALHPDADALWTPEGGSVRYGALARQANRLARGLRAAGVRSGARVAVLMPRGADQVTACLAVLTAGGVYVPVDPALPAARQALMIGDCAAAAVVLGNGAALPAGLPSDLPVLPFARTLARPDLPDRTPDIEPVRADDPAYVIYTSGTTGRPKGVLCTHRGIVRLVRSGGVCQARPGDRVVHGSSVLFDINLPEVWGPLLNGATVLILPPGPLEPHRLPGYLRAGGATTLSLATSVFHMVVDTCPDALAGLSCVMVGGETLSPDHARRALAVLGPKGRLINGYGPTENATYSTQHAVTPADLEPGPIPIGHPIANSTVHLVDPFGNPVPPGVPGEVIVGGDGVARGYLGQPAQTAERFLSPNPHPVPLELDAARAYRTGDLALRRPGDGALMFLGRRDTQIKLRGFRIELDEITGALRACPGVRDGIVVVDDSGPGRRLAAYFCVADTVGSTDPWPAVRTRLAEALPAYMVPDVAVVLPALPLSPVGKVDRHALPPVPPPAGETAALRPPATETERAVHGVWADVLGHDRFGIDDDFFALGGDSLYATQVASRLGRRLEMEVPVATVLTARTISALAARLDATTLSGASPDALAAILAELDLDSSVP